MNIYCLIKFIKQSHLQRNDSNYTGGSNVFDGVSCKLLLHYKIWIWKSLLPWIKTLKLTTDCSHNHWVNIFKHRTSQGNRKIEQSVWVEVANKTLRPSEFLLCSHCSSFTADVGSLSAHETQLYSHRSLWLLTVWRRSPKEARVLMWLVTLMDPSGYWVKMSYTVTATETLF